MKVGISAEIFPGERRVAGTPDTVERLTKMGFEVLVESGAGKGALFSDEHYRAAGAEIIETREELWSESRIVLKVRPPAMLPDGSHEADLLSEGGTLISFVWPAKNEALINRLAERKANVLAMDMVPRISRAQKMDALSSMANIAGYRAVLEAASFFGRFFTGQMTAAGRIPPAQVLVIGAGVAGLSAIGTARGMGAIVKAFDTRPVVKEQVESMGAEFLTVELEEDGSGQGGYAKTMSKEFIEAEMALFKQQAAEVDIIITTALIPGRPAPVLLPTYVVEAMKPGSVIVDLAAEEGGNCELTQPEKVVDHNGITIVGYVDLPSRLAPTASQLYGSNLCHLLEDMGQAEDFLVDEENEVVRGALVLLHGALKWPPPQVEPSPVPKAATKPVDPPVPALDVPPAAKKGAWGSAIGMLVGACLLAAVGAVAPKEFLGHFTVFVLACFVGWQVVWNVSPALHTPLMSVTNAVSGIILVGGLLQLSGPASSPVTILAGIAVLVATINIVGGFLVTHRMLAMFRK
jgi:NAD(P) transhydrogenase subunit alpha